MRVRAIPDIAPARSRARADPFPLRTMIAAEMQRSPRFNATRVAHGFALVGALLAVGTFPRARAEVRQSAADSFVVSLSETVNEKPGRAYDDITQVQRWWDSQHTWSGKAANLSLKAVAGGCFCERWNGGSAEHGHVIMALPGKLLRLEASLGPLQELALKGVLSIWIRSENDATSTLVLEYRVNGAANSGLDGYAPNVDAMLAEQFERLKRFIETGKPDAPAQPEQPEQKSATPLLPESAGAGESPEAARERILEQWKESAESERAAARGKPAPKPETSPGKP